jgi:hypothetical protein
MVLKDVSKIACSFLIIFTTRKEPMQWYEEPWAKYRLDSVNYVARGLFIFYFINLYLNSTYSSAQKAKLSGFEPDEILELLKLSTVEEAIRPSTYTKLSDDNYLKLEAFLKFSTQACNVVGALKKESFSIGTTNILDTTKNVSYYSYQKEIKKLLTKRSTTYPFTQVELEACESILDSFICYKKQYSPYLIYIAQTQCMYKLGYPFFKWNLEYYLEAVYHSMIQIFHCAEKKPPSKLALNYVSDMIEAVGFVDLDMESVLYQNSEELFSLFDLVNLFTTKEK